MTGQVSNSSGGGGGGGAPSTGSEDGHCGPGSPMGDVVVSGGPSVGQAVVSNRAMNNLGAHVNDSGGQVPVVGRAHGLPHGLQQQQQQHDHHYSINPSGSVQFGEAPGPILGLSVSEMAGHDPHGQQSNLKSEH